MTVFLRKIAELLVPLKMSPVFLKLPKSNIGLLFKAVSLVKGVTQGLAGTDKKLRKKTFLPNKNYVSKLILILHSNIAFNFMFSPKTSIKHIVV